ncbi:MAG: D-alanine--D-alanine ligase [Phycisphaeraceae bacterium]|nr:D-alanine--D-alanine ligase [Phycisphaeraceae bacterium]
MRIGITFDLRDEYLALGWSEQAVAEFDRADTIDAIEQALAALGHEADRIGGASALIERLARGDRWDLVLNIAEGRRGTGREALIPALLDHHEIPYTFGDPLCCAVTLDKPTCKRVLASHGVPTPAMGVVQTLDQIDRIGLAFPVFAKPSREGSSKGVGAASVCRDAAQLRAVCAGLLDEFDQPVLVEAFLPGQEVTVGLVGTGDAARVVGVLGVGLTGGSEVYGYDDKERCEEVVEYRLEASAFARRAADLALAAYRAVGCRDAGRVDVRADALGNPQVIEVNALAGLHPSHSDLPIMAGLAGWAYADLIEQIVASAASRVGRGRSPAAGAPDRVTR